MSELIALLVYLTGLAGFSIYCGWSDDGRDPARGLVMSVFWPFVCFHGFFAVIGEYLKLAKGSRP